MKPRLVVDPWLPWPGPIPYAYLTERLRAVGHAGLTPDSTTDEVQDDAPFALMAGGTVTQRDQLALDELGHVERRLLLDFFHYRFDEEASRE